jgi:hypothetical protein
LVNFFIHDTSNFEGAGKMFANDTRESGAIVIGNISNFDRKTDISVDISSEPKDSNQRRT